MTADYKLILPDTQSFSSVLNLTNFDNNWVLVKEHYYLLRATLLDIDNHHIHMTDNVIIKNNLMGA